MSISAKTLGRVNRTQLAQLERPQHSPTSAYVPSVNTNHISFPSSARGDETQSRSSRQSADSTLELTSASPHGDQFDVHSKESYSRHHRDDFSGAVDYETGSISPRSPQASPSSAATSISSQFHYVPEQTASTTNNEPVFTRDFGGFL
jgi:hypothetical protein